MSIICDSSKICTMLIKSWYNILLIVRHFIIKSIWSNVIVRNFLSLSRLIDRSIEISISEQDRNIDSFPATRDFTFYL